MQGVVWIYSELLELKYPWTVDKVSPDSSKKVVEEILTNEIGAKLPCHECQKECMVYDHLVDREWRDLESIGFKTFIHAKPARKQCTEPGIKAAVMPLSESRSRFTLIFELISIRVLQNMDLYNLNSWIFTTINLRFIHNSLAHE